MKKRKYSHSKAKQQADKNYSMNKVSLSVAFSRFEALKERLRRVMQELFCFVMDR